MSCPEPTACNSCPSDGQHNGVGDIEDYKVELESLRKRTAELEQKLAEVGLVNNAKAPAPTKFRSSRWFNDPENPEMSALYADRYLNYGLTQEELMSGKPIIGIAQSGSDLAPCNRYHLVLAKRVREGIRSAGGIAFEFPTHPIQESSRRPTATLDRNLAYLGLVELLHAYFLDGVVLLTGCDKTTPAFLMAAATVVSLLLSLCGSQSLIKIQNIPAICFNVGPMLNGRIDGSSDRIGSGVIVWKARDLHAAGEIDDDKLVEMIAAG